MVLSSSGLVTRSARATRGGRPRGPGRPPRAPRSRRRASTSASFSPSPRRASSCRATGELLLLRHEPPGVSPRRAHLQPEVPPPRPRTASLSVTAAAFPEPRAGEAARPGTSSPPRPTTTTRSPRTGRPARRRSRSAWSTECTAARVSTVERPCTSRSAAPGAGSIFDPAPKSNASTSSRPENHSPSMKFGAGGSAALEDEESSSSDSDSGGGLSANARSTHMPVRALNPALFGRTLSARMSLYTATARSARFPPKPPGLNPSLSAAASVASSGATPASRIRQYVATHASWSPALACADISPSARTPGSTPPRSRIASNVAGALGVAGARRRRQRRGPRARAGRGGEAARGRVAHLAQHAKRRVRGVLVGSRGGVLVERLVWRGGRGGGGGGKG